MRLLLNHRVPTWIHTWGLVSLLACLPSDGHAQQTVSPRVQVTVVMVEELPSPGDSGDVALISRRRAGDPQPDLIFLPVASADGESLSSAVFLLLLARQVERHGTSGERYLRVPRRSFPTAWIGSEIRRADGVVERLRQARKRSMPGVGLVRGYDLFLPSSIVFSRLEQIASGTRGGAHD